MTSERQREANRANAQKSTGPKSRAGKARASLNALSHGLSSRAAFGAEGSTAADQLVREIEQSLAGLIDPADVRIFAEAEVEVRRAHSAMKTILSKDAADARNGFRPERTAYRERAARLPSSSAGKQDDEAVVSIRAIAELKKVDRYLRRAVSKRNRAFQLCLEVRGEGSKGNTV
jgi:hypothetical protein